MNVVFFEVDNVLNFEGSEAKAPDGSMGISEARVRELKQALDMDHAKPVLYGAWAKDWDFDDAKCTARGTYLNKKLNRRGIHILDKVNTEQDINAWLKRHDNVTHHIILKAGENFAI